MRQKIVAALLLLSACGCGKLHQEKLYTQTAVLCGTFVEISSPEQKALPIAFHEIQRLCAVFNVYDAHSELSRINNSYNAEITVSPEMAEVLSLSKELYRMTDGAFDVSSGKLFQYWKDMIRGVQGIPRVPESRTVTGLKADTGIDCIEINRERRSVTLRKKGVTIDLSGIAKGYIVDRAIGALRKQGVASCLINSGGDMYALGTIRGKPWKIGVRDPDDARRYIDTFSVTNAGMATSGDYEQSFMLDGKRYSHIINPKTGFPAANNLVSTTVIAPNLTLADALATAFFVMGKEKTQEFMNTHKNLVVAVLEEKDAHGRKTYYCR